MMDEETTMKTETVMTLGGDLLGVGRLGATVREGADTHVMLIAALDLAERRILRMEMVLRRAGLEPESVELPR